MKIRLLLILFLVLSKGAFSKKIASGYWHTTLHLNDSTDLPVTFMVEKERKDYHIFVINAAEKIELQQVDRTRDSITLRFPAFRSELKCKILNKKEVEGFWYNYAKGSDYRIPFIAKKGDQSRFPILTQSIDVSGQWEVTFDYNGKPEKALGIFSPLKTHGANNQQQMVQGTFLTETGDYRFLEGVTSNDSLNLSTFDGSHAFLFQSKLVNDTLWGQFYSGNHYHVNWHAVRNEHFELTDPDSLTYIVNQRPLTLSLPNLNNEIYSYPNASGQGKVTLIQIMGTWCPNCLDESRYLKEKKSTYGNQLQIISVAFEMPETLAGRIEKVQSFQQDLDLDFTFLIGGKASKKEALKQFPMLNEVISFPTLIFIDKTGDIRKIHTGFNGPGTGQYYKDFVTKTDKFIESLIQE